LSKDSMSPQGPPDLSHDSNDHVTLEQRIWL
jgi:hypothetical protein